MDEPPNEFWLIIIGIPVCLGMVLYGLIWIVLEIGEWMNQPRARNAKKK